MKLNKLINRSILDSNELVILSVCLHITRLLVRSLYLNIFALVSNVSSYGTLGEWVNVVWDPPATCITSVKEGSRHVYLSRTNGEDEEHFKDVHPCLRACSVLSH